MIVTIRSIAGSKSGHTIDYLIGKVGKDGVVRDGYFTDASKGEPPGVWMGSALSTFGFEIGQQVATADLRAFADGNSPTTGEPLQPGRPGDPMKRVAGFEMTFHVIKDVSLLRAFGDEHTRREIAIAESRAVAEALHLFEKMAFRGHRGAQGKNLVESKGVFAVFPHRTSRSTEAGVPGDPQDHFHVFIPNIGVGPDGKVTSLVQPELFALYRKIAGPYAAAILRQELTERLGIVWEEVGETGLAKIAGMDQKLVSLFSKRRNEILRETVHLDDAAARQAVAYKTRKGKEGGYSYEELRNSWIAQAEEAGFDVSDLLEKVVARGEAWKKQRNAEVELGVAFDRAVAPGSDQWILRKATELESVVSRADVFRRLCESAELRGIHWSEIEEEIDTILAHQDVVELAAGHHAAPQVEGGFALPYKRQQRYTTREVVAAEVRVLRTARLSRGAGVAVVNHEAVEAAIEGSARRGIELGEDQARMVRSLCEDGHGVAIVQAPPGTGKTTTLETVRRAYAAAGYNVVGASTAGKAARELESGSQIPSRTIASVLLAMDEGNLRFTDRHVLVIDEAGMVGTRALDRLITSARGSGAKVILVGDYKQIPSVEAGGLFRDLVDENRDIVVELTENRRQKSEWEREIVSKIAVLVDATEGKRPSYHEWEAGVRAPTAEERLIQNVFDTYLEHGRVVSHKSSVEMAADLVQQHFADLEAGKSSVMIAYQRATVARLNEIAREVAEQRGMLGDETHFGGKTWREGERVICTLGKGKVGVLNGTTGVVVGVKSAGTTFRVEAVNANGKKCSWNSERQLEVGEKVTLGADTVTVEKVTPTKTENRLIVRTDAGEELAIDADYAERHLELGYAVTAHKSQGGTWDVARVDPKGMTPNLLHVAVSRGREANVLYFAEHEHEVDELDLQRCHVREAVDTPANPLMQFATIFLRDGHESSALREATKRTEADIDWLDLELRRRELAQQMALKPKSSAERRGEIGKALERARAEGDSMAVEVMEGEMVRLTPRDDYTPEEDLLLAKWVENNKELVGEWEQVAMKLDRSTAIIAAYAEAEEPHYLPERPDSPTEIAKWKKKCAVIETYRRRHGIDPSQLTRDQPLGPSPKDPTRREDWITAHQLMDQDQERAVGRSIGIRSGLDTIALE